MNVGDFLLVNDPNDDYCRADVVWLRRIVRIKHEKIWVQPWHTTDTTDSYRRFKPTWWHTESKSETISVSKPDGKGYEAYQMKQDPDMIVQKLDKGAVDEETGLLSLETRWILENGDWTIPSVSFHED